MENGLKKYDVVLVNFGQGAIGCEQGGIRPAIIVQNNTGNHHSPTTLAMPLTKRIKHPGQPTHTIIQADSTKGISVDSMVVGEAVKQISEQRIICRLGTITDEVEQKEIKRVYNANFGD